MRVTILHVERDTEHAADLVTHLAGLRRKLGFQVESHLVAPEQTVAVPQGMVLVLFSAQMVAWWADHGSPFVRAVDHEECRVVPVLVRACDLASTSAVKLQFLPRCGVAVSLFKDADLAWSQIVAEIRPIIKGLL